MGIHSVIMHDIYQYSFSNIWKQLWIFCFIILLLGVLKWNVLTSLSFSRMPWRSYKIWSLYWHGSQASPRRLKCYPTSDQWDRFATISIYWKGTAIHSYLIDFNAFSLKTKQVKVTGIRPMAPVLNTGPPEGTWPRNVKFFGKERNC